MSSILRGEQLPLCEVPEALQTNGSRQLRQIFSDIRNVLSVVSEAILYEDFYACF